jgi:hypothetical protein
MRALAAELPGRARASPASTPPAEAMHGTVTSASRTDHARPDLDHEEPALGQVAATLGLDRLARHQAAAQGGVRSAGCAVGTAQAGQKRSGPTRSRRCLARAGRGVVELFDRAGQRSATVGAPRVRPRLRCPLRRSRGSPFGRISKPEGSRPAASSTATASANAAWSKARACLTSLWRVANSALTFSLVRSARRPSRAPAPVVGHQGREHDRVQRGAAALPCVTAGAPGGGLGRGNSSWGLNATSVKSSQTSGSRRY